MSGVVVLMLVSSSAAWAQQGTADLRGRGVDQQGSAPPPVPIVVRNQESGLFRDTVSGADGSFLLSGMNAGTYEVTAELAGFRRYQSRGVERGVGRSTQLEIKLELGAIEESVTVTGESPLVDTNSKAIGGNVTAKEFVDHHFISDARQPMKSDTG